MAGLPANALPVPTDPPPPDGVLRYLGFGGCVRLPLRVDARLLAAQLARLPADVWGRAGRDPVVLGSVESFYVVGYPRGPRPLPADDRPPLAELPYLKELLHQSIPAPPLRAIVARLLPGGLIPLHSDARRHFSGIVRVSIQVASDGVQRLYCDGLWYDQAPGEVWVIDNLRPHGVHNGGASPRTNVLAEYPPSEDLVRWIIGGDHGLGVADAVARAALESMTRDLFRRSRWRRIRWELVKRIRRCGT